MKKSKQFELLYNELEADHMLRGRPRSYQDLKSMVRMHLDKETRDKHLDANKEGSRQRSCCYGQPEVR